MIHEYLEQIHAMLTRAEETQQSAMKEAARLMCQATMAGRRIYTFGCNHGGLLAMELFYRTGGLANVEWMHFPGLALDVTPPTITSSIEGLPGYGRLAVEAYPIQPGDVVLIHSVSGKNMVTVDVALAAKERGATVLALTNVALSASSPAIHPSGKHLFEAADVVIDNCGGESDAVLTIPGCEQKVSPSSTAVGAAILNAVVAETARLLTEQGYTPPILASCNAEGGAAYNQKLLQQ